MAQSPVTNLEKESLEAQVDLCALRYEQLDKRMTKLEEKVEHIHEDIVHGQKSMTKVLVGTAGTVIAAVASVIVTILLKM